MTEPVVITDPVVVEPVKNDAPTVTEPNTELIAANKRAEQAEMRARQLENEKKDREKLDEVARQKQLEDNEEFKTLYEREKEARERLEAERQDEDTRKTIQSAKAEIFAGYSPEVIELAEATGIDLYDESDASQEAFKAKLDIITSKIPTTTKTVHGSNPSPTAPALTDDTKVLLNRLRYDDRSISRSARRTLISNLPELREMRGIANSQE